LAEPDRGAEAVPEAANDASRGSAGRTDAAGRDFWVRIRDSGRLGWLLLGLVLAAAIVLVVAEFTTISFRTIHIGACEDRVGAAKCHTTGHSSNGYALLILALAGLVMAWGAIVGRSRAAAIALAAVGVAVLVVALAIDLPKLNDNFDLDVLYEDVRTHVGIAFKLELVGGVLLLLAGGLALGRLGEEEAEPVAPAEPEPEPEDEAVASPEGEPEPEAYRPSPRTTARAKARERSRQRQRRKRDSR
jgi:hypothetical protein